MELLERLSQLQVLNSALSQVKGREGQGCVALVYGEAGIGKTSLVEHFLNEHKTKWRILQGACDSLFTLRPLGPLHDIEPQAQGDLLSLLESESNRQAVFSACHRELKEQVTILVISTCSSFWAAHSSNSLNDDFPLRMVGSKLVDGDDLILLSHHKGLESLSAVNIDDAEMMSDP